MPFIFERATIALESKNDNRINSIKKKEELKIKAHSCFGTQLPCTQIIDERISFLKE
jgi:hypothetical protein